MNELAAGSELLRTVASIRQDGGIAIALGDVSLRQLFKPEIDVLESLGNTSRDWSLVRVAEGFNARRVRDCEFHGRVVLGCFNKYVLLADGLEVVAGLSRSTIADCVIGHNALIRDVRLLANYVVCEEASVVDCGRVTCRANSSFGNGERIPLALEWGGRDVDIFAEIDVELAALVARPGERRAELEGYRRAVSKYRDAATIDRGIIGNGARVWDVQRVEDTYIGQMARVDGATQVVRSTLLSSPDQPVVVESGSLVADSILQWGSRVADLAIVEKSVLIEHACVERHGKVKNSLIGACSEVAAGEVSSCLLGPLVNCPHQSLLISTFWPEGRGNIGYGANVGSNHTSRGPDQEFRAGEGMFIGLGVNVKFPCDFSESPYTVIACGVDLPPQKVVFPFSLIVQPEAGARNDLSGLNRIRPGWMLYENIYALKRNEAKYRARYHAKRTNVDFDVFRMDTVSRMRDAIRTLESPTVVREFYTEREIPGLGKNYLTESDRICALEAYRFYTRHRALLAHYNRIAKPGPETQVAGTLLREPETVDQVRKDQDWSLYRTIIVEDAGINSLEKLLALFHESAVEIAKACERSRAKDETRGVRIIDDYAAVHSIADRDRIVKAAWDEANQIQKELQEAHGDPKARQFVELFAEGNDLKQRLTRRTLLPHILALKRGQS